MRILRGRGVLDWIWHADVWMYSVQRWHLFHRGWQDQCMPALFGGDLRGKYTKHGLHLLSHRYLLDGLRRHDQLHVSILSGRHVQHCHRDRHVLQMQPVLSRELLHGERGGDEPDVQPVRAGKLLDRARRPEQPDLRVLPRGVVFDRRGQHRVQALQCRDLLDDPLDGLH